MGGDLSAPHRQVFDAGGGTGDRLDEVGDLVHGDSDTGPTVDGDVVTVGEGVDEEASELVGVDQVDGLGSAGWLSRSVGVIRTSFRSPTSSGLLGFDPSNSMETSGATRTSSSPATGVSYDRRRRIRHPLRR